MNDTTDLGYLKNYLNDVKGIILDYGGTLDTGGTHWSRVIWEAWQEAGVATTLPVFREAYVYAERELARTSHILPQHDFHDLLNIKINIELQWLAHQGEFPAGDVAPMAGKIASICNDAASDNIKKTIPVLEDLAARYPIVLVSNFYGNIKKVLEQFGIAKYFKSIIESAVVGIRKPDPGIFSLGVKALDFRADECVVVGDSYDKDMQPAHEAGCKAVWLKGAGWSGEEDLREYPATINSLEELRDALL